MNNKKFEINSFIKENYLLIISVFIWFAMLLVFINIQHFIDENDNFLGALMVANGRDVYSHHISQHMPFAYYIFAIPALFGVSSIAGFRIAFYIILILIWACMYFRYKDKFGKVTMLLYPIMYITTMSYYYALSNSAVSDQFQAQGMAIIFLEFLYFVKTRKVDYKSSIFISLAVLLSFGTTFVAALALFVIFCGVFGVEIFDLIRQKTKLKDGFLYLWKKFRFLFAIVLAPFVILMIYYALTGNLYNFYFGAYELNITVYADYSNLGGSILMDILKTIPSYANMIINNFSTLFGNGVESLRLLCLVIVNIMFGFHIYKTKKWLLLIVIPFVLMCGIRDFSGFHAMAYHAATLIQGCILFNEYFIVQQKKSATLKVVATVLIMGIGISFVPNLSAVTKLSYTFQLQEIAVNTNDWAVTVLTEPDEPVFVSTLDTGMYLRTNRLPIYSPSTPVPWMWQVHKEKDFEFLEEYQPKIVVHDDNHVIWGYKLKEYAPDFIEYVHEHYTPLSEQFPNIYVRNDYREEAVSIITAQVESLKK